MTHQTPLLAALALLAGSAARAETIEGSSSTFLLLGEDTRYRGGARPDLVTVAPAFEVLNLTASDMQLGFFEDVRAVLSAWAAVDLAQRRWDNGTGSSSFGGDLTTGYVEGKALDRRVTLRLGRSMVPTGVARMIQLDGGFAAFAAPTGPLVFKVSSYVGSPTAQRFSDRSGEKSWDPAGGTVAYGGRVAAALPIDGWPGRGLELGVDFNEVDDRGHLARQELGGDLRLQPFAGNDLALAGFTSVSLPERRVSEASAALSVSATRRLHLTGDLRYVEPSLLLSRFSILSVFSASTWTELGGGARYQLARWLTAGLAAHLRLEPGATSGTHAGMEVAASLDGTFSSTTAGAELSVLDAEANGYTALRVYARRVFGPAFVAAQVMPQLFRERINEQRGAVTGTLSGGVALAPGLAAVVSGAAGTTPYLKESYSLFVKLAYNQTYRVEEVRR